MIILEFIYAVLVALWEGTLCFFGSHNWHDFGYNGKEFRVCRRCSRQEKLVTEEYKYWDRVK